MKEYQKHPEMMQGVQGSAYGIATGSSNINDTNDRIGSSSSSSGNNRSANTIQFSEGAKLSQMPYGFTMVCA